MGVLDDRLEIFTAPGRLIALVAGAVALIGASLFVALGFGDAPQGSFLRFVGWLGVVFFGGCLLLILRQLLFLRGPVVVMDRQGLLDRRLSRDPVPWRQITDLGLWQTNGQQVIVLTVPPKTEAAIGLSRIARMSRGMNARLGADGLCVAATGLTTPPGELLSLIRDRVAAAHKRG